MNKIKQPKLGGSRPGSGRPKGSGRYQEPTQPIRIPNSLVPQVNDLLSHYLEEIAHSLGASSEFKNRVFQPIIRSIRTLPIYANRVAAGFPAPTDDRVESKLDLNQHLIKRPTSTFFVRVEGESMIGAGIYPNDILIVDRSLEPRDGKIVIAVLNGELTVKRLKMSEENLTLQAENDRFPDIQITEEADFRIWGVVTNVVHAV